MYIKFHKKSVKYIPIVYLLRQKLRRNETNCLLSVISDIYEYIKEKNPKLTISPEKSIYFDNFFVKKLIEQMKIELF